MHDVEALGTFALVEAEFWLRGPPRFPPPGIHTLGLYPLLSAGKTSDLQI